VQLQDDYFAAYRSLKVTRDTSGVLVVEFHSNGGPFTFTAQDHTEFVRRLLPDRAGPGEQDCNPDRSRRGFHPWGVVAEVVPNGKVLSRARELAELYLKAPEVTRRNTRVHFMQPLKERIVREVGYGLSLEGASAADLVKSMQAKSEPVARKEKSA
jgi:hypothetical protein